MMYKPTTAGPMAPYSPTGPGMTGTMPHRPGFGKPPAPHAGMMPPPMQQPGIMGLLQRGGMPGGGRFFGHSLNNRAV